MLIAVNWLDPKSLIETFGTIGLILVVFVESGLIPAPLPGDSILFLAGAFSRHDQGRRPAPEPRGGGHRLVPRGGRSAASSAISIGNRYGTRLFKPDARFFKTEYLERAQVFFDKRGPRAVVLARFIPFVRTIVPMLAGAGRMPFRKFVVANVIGAAIWAVGISLLGYWLGKSIDIDKWIYPIVAVIIVLVVDPAVPRVPQAQAHPSGEKLNRRELGAYYGTQLHAGS